MERVYAAERVANEAPQLAQTKRTTVWMTDMEKFVSAGDKAISSLNDWSYYRDNYSLKIGDKESDEFNQFDTTLADLDSVIMTQYQIVAAAANVPATKLLGTTPKGFNSTGEYEEASYHEELKSIQANHMTALAERHHELVMKSYIAPKFGYIQTAVTWNPLDTPTALELAQTNLAKAQVGAALIASGAISSEDERARVAKDKESGYNELGEDDVPAGEEVMDEDFNESEHPRADNGQFGSGGKSSSTKKTKSVKLKEGHVQLETPVKAYKDAWGDYLIGHGRLSPKQVTIKNGEIVGVTPKVAAELKMNTIGEVQGKSENTIQKEQSAEESGKKEKELKEDNAAIAVASMQIPAKISKLSSVNQEKAKQEIIKISKEDLRGKLKVEKIMTLLKSLEENEAE
jgi:hypothetical protein